MAAKTVTISQAEYEYLQTVIAHDGMIIAKFEVELAQAKKDIRQLLIHHTSLGDCEYCAHNCDCDGKCEQNAEWRGCGRDSIGNKQ